MLKRPSFCWGLLPPSYSGQQIKQPKDDSLNRVFKKRLFCENLEQKLSLTVQQIGNSGLTAGTINYKKATPKTRS